MLYILNLIALKPEITVSVEHKPYTDLDETAKMSVQFLRPSVVQSKGT